MLHSPPTCARCAGRPNHAPSEDCAEYVDLSQLPEVERTMELLKPGALINLTTGQPAQDSLESRAQMFLHVLQAEKSHNSQLQDMLNAEKGLPLKHLQDWAWHEEHMEWRREFFRAKMWVHRNRDSLGWTYGAAMTTWSDSDILEETEVDCAWWGMHLVHKRVRDMREVGKL